MKKTVFIFSLFILMSCTKKGVDTSTEERSVFPVKRGSLEGKLSWKGIVRSAERVEILSDKKVRVSKILAHNFDVVKKGQLLIEVDNSEQTNKYNELKNRAAMFALDLEGVSLKFKYAIKARDRKALLLQKGILSQKEADDAFRDTKVAETELKSKTLEKQKIDRDLQEIEEQMKVANFYAPVDGTLSDLITLETLNGGETQMGQVVGVVSDPKKLALWVSVEETQIHHLQIGSEATVSLDAFPGETFEGKVVQKSLSSQSGQEKHLKTYEVSILFHAKDKKIQEGFGGKLSYVYVSKSDALAIPLSAVRYLDGKDFVVATSSAKGSGSVKNIEVGVKTETEAEIKRGLTENEFVLVDSTDGAK